MDCISCHTHRRLTLLKGLPLLLQIWGEWRKWVNRVVSETNTGKSSLESNKIEIMHKSVCIYKQLGCLDPTKQGEAGSWQTWEWFSEDGVDHFYKEGKGEVKTTAWTLLLIFNLNWGLNVFQLTSVFYHWLPWEQDSVSCLREVWSVFLLIVCFFVALNIAVWAPPSMWLESFLCCACLWVRCGGLPLQRMWSEAQKFCDAVSSRLHRRSLAGSACLFADWNWQTTVVILSRI